MCNKCEKKVAITRIICYNSCAKILKGVHICEETNYQFVTGDDYAAQYCTCYSLGRNDKHTKYCCAYRGAHNETDYCAYHGAYNEGNNRAHNGAYNEGNNRAHNGAYHESHHGAYYKADYRAYYGTYH